MVAELGRGHLRHHPDKGGTWRHLERPGRLLEAVLGLEGSIGVLEGEINTTLEQNAKKQLQFQFYEGGLRVGITKYCKFSKRLLPGSGGGLTNHPRALYQHRENPYR